MPFSASLLVFLKSPASYAHRPAEVRSTETHICWVFFASPLVFKVKKPVNLGFLDFSTLEKRQHFCEREVRLNRRLSPDIYLAVTPLYGRPSRFSFEETGGAVVEYAVKMRELPQGLFLSELLAKGAVGEMEINRVIARLYRFYDSETPTAEIEEWGRPREVEDQHR